MAEQGTRPAYSYARVSGGAQARRGEGLQRQIAAAEAWAAAQGLELDNALELTDAGKSASKGQHIAAGGALGRFLAAAQAGQLGPDPVLLIEGFSRLSRLEPLDSLDRIVSPLVRAGVTIITLEDGAEYTLQRLNQDPAALLALVLRAQAASEYAKRLSEYSSSARAANRADIIAGKPVCTGWAVSWIAWDADRQEWKLTPYESTVRRAIELAWDHGVKAVAKQLNAEGHLSPGGRPWSAMPVRSLLLHPALHGARRIAEPGHPEALRRWREACRLLPPGAQRPRKPTRRFIEVEGSWPAILTPDEHRALLARMARRQSAPHEKGRRDRLYYVAQGLTTCACGGLIGAETTRLKRGTGSPYIYLRCKSRQKGLNGCTAPGIRLEPVQDHLLTRLASDELAQVLDGPAAAGELQQLLGRQRELQVELEAANARLTNATEALAQRAMAGGAVAQAYEGAVEQASSAVEAAQGQLAATNSQIQDREQRPGGLAVQAAVQRLLKTFARGEDTPADRQSINRLLRRLNVSIVLDTAQERLGLAVGDGPVDWQPLERGSAQAALAEGWSGVRFIDAGGGAVLFGSPRDERRFAEQVAAAGLAAEPG